ncbi:MAG: nitroreductase family protein [bacterium]
MIRDLIVNSRSCRRFDEDHAVSSDVLLGLVELARFSPSAANLQPLRYILCTSAEKRGLIFSTLSWAAYLSEWPGPAEGERPSAYIILLGDTSLSRNFQCDAGIACQSILLGAAEQGLGGCILGSIDRERIRILLSVPERFEILYVIALGKPAETIVLDDAPGDGNIRYWRDDKGVHHVPKRTRNELVLNII